jgi:hypothetical protein
MLTTHPHLVSKLTISTISRAVRLLAYAFTVWTGTTLCFTFLQFVYQVFRLNFTILVLIYLEMYYGHIMSRCGMSVGGMGV